MSCSLPSSRRSVLAFVLLVCSSLPLLISANITTRKRHLLLLFLPLPSLSPFRSSVLCQILLVDSTVDVCSAIDCTQLRNASTTCTGSNCNAAMPVFRTEYAVIIIFVVIVIGVAIVIIVVQYGKLQNEKKRLRRVLDHSSNGTGSSARRSGRVVPVPHEAAPVPLDATATRASP
mmetsp:Transcript_6818/g.17144  ORF Transcript_6818/g.17144 Transcript_6818/m.17144 type:complete len:175 (-) Transcript_6818:559-1083(-)